MKLKSINKPLITALVLVLFNSCALNDVEVAMTTTDVKDGLAAVDKITHQGTLEHIALNAKSFAVRNRAIGRLTNQTILVKIAMEDSSWELRYKAGQMLTDANLVAKMAKEYHDQDLPNGIIQLADLSFLSKIALAGNGISAIERLSEPEMLAKMKLEKNDKNVYLISMYIHSFDGVPENRKDDLLRALFPALLLLNDSAMVGEIGEITSIQSDWQSVRKIYREGYLGKGKEILIPGEKFSFTIATRDFEKKNRLHCTWESEFPLTVPAETKFLKVKITLIDLLAPIFNRVSDRVLINLADQNANLDIAKAAIERMSDTSALNKFASTYVPGHIDKGYAAKERLEKIRKKNQR